MRSPIRFASFVAALLGLCMPASGWGAAAKVELTTASGGWQGKSLAHDTQICWLLESTGELHHIPLAEVTSFRRLDESFRPETVVEARDRMRRTLPKGMEVAAKGRYVVCAPTGSAATYAALLDSVYASFWMHFSRRSFGLQQPEFPLIALVFPTRQQFVEYAKRDQTPVSASLAGYYHRRTNRIALFADPSLTTKTSAGDASGATTPGMDQITASLAAPGEESFGSIEAGARDTLVHEATHQLAFNTGLHSRIGETPRWITEGLAMLFEEDSRRDDTGKGQPVDRVNRSRFLWFGNYRQSRRAKKSLAALIEADAPFSAAPLDFYSEAWAVSFYLAETRPAEYSKFLRSVAARDPLAPYTAEERLTDFQTAFGRNLDYFEGQYLMYLGRIDLK